MTGAAEGFCVYRADHPGELASWLEQWRSSPEREPFAHPEYARLFARALDWVVCLAWRGREGGILLPLVVRPLEAEPWFGGPDGAVDAVTPYGYGGPWAWGVAPREAAAFWQELRRWAEGSRVVSAFARLCLFPEESVPFPGAVREHSQNVVRSLRLSEEELWRDYAHKVRKNVKRARSHGLAVEVDREGRRLSEFTEIYWQTMERREARQSYFFPAEFFATLCRRLQECCALFHVLQGDRLVSTELVLLSGSSLYSFLGGTRAEAFELRANDLLKHELIRWGMEQGQRRFVLGGGYERDDGIFRYKLSFAPTGTVPFRVGQMVLDEGLYRALVRRRREWEAQRGREWTPGPIFFPAYRAT